MTARLAQFAFRRHPPEALASGTWHRRPPRRYRGPPLPLAQIRCSCWCGRPLFVGATLRAVDYLQAVRWRLTLRDRVAKDFADIDLAITASSTDPACRIDDDEALAANYWRQARMPFNVTGQPGLVIPTGFTKSGLPLSLQLVGHPFGEAVLYRVAQFYEDATGWTKRHPPGLSE